MHGFGAHSRQRSMMFQSENDESAGSPVGSPEVVDDSPEGTPNKKDSAKRVRKRGNIEDAVFGLICHNCRQRSIEDHVTCSRCPLRFCGPCLLNRHGEQMELELRENVRWVCPRCRGGCGPGCVKTCCNCGPCRKSRKLQPTGQLVRTARDAGFSNVHDYLVHLETGESPAAIASRKNGRGWTSTDGSHGMEIVAVVLGRQHSALALTEKGRSKKLRSRRFLKVNPNWGSPTIPGYNEQEVYEGRLLVAGLRSTWDVGQKLKSKWPDFSTEGQIFTREQILDSNWETGRNLQSESPDSRTGDLVQSLDSTREIGRKPRKFQPKKKPKKKRPDSQDAQILTQEQSLDSTLQMKPDVRTEDRIVTQNQSLLTQLGGLEGESQWSDFDLDYDNLTVEDMLGTEQGFTIQSVITSS